MSFAAPEQLLLTGPPAVGKSTVGRLVALRLGVPFVDLDDAAAARAGLSAGALFARGEAVFRAAEREALRALLDEPGPRVIALGGGALVDADLRREALSRAIVVGLHAPPDVLGVRAAAGDRPLLAQSSPDDRAHALAVLVDARRAVYADVHLTVDATTDREHTAERVARVAHDLAPIAPPGVVPHAALVVDDAALREELTALVTRLAPSSITVVTDTNVAPLHARAITDALPDARVVVRPAGEQHKTFTSLEALLVELADAGVDREGLLIGLGGGVTTDVTGLAAALHARGLRWLAVPTSLMGMVDAATGGKTAVNLGASKNGVGAFHHPRAVLVAPAFSSTEDARAVRAALAEVVKVAAVLDASLIGWLEEHADALASRDAPALREAVRRALAIKARVVTSDPDERGVRRLLNFGHTFGHALEAASRYESFLHGEAVAIGMRVALRVGASLGLTPAPVVERLDTLVRRLSGGARPLDPALITAATAELFRDKKRAGRAVRFIVVRAAGDGAAHPVELDALGELIAQAAAALH